jgi:polyisoprenoid-binding protein YceI
MYAAILLVAACNSPKGDNAEAGDKQAVAATDGIVYTLDSTSKIYWAASKPTQTHEGTFDLSEGTFRVKDNALTGGSFTINVASLLVTDLKPADGKEKLEGHLKSPDFFDVAKFPSAKFEITSLLPYTADSASTSKDATHMVSGNLTLRDSTKNVTFPAKITIDAQSLVAKANFNIDRTQWGMNYKGPNNPQDWFISKEVKLKLDISASRK